MHACMMMMMINIWMTWVALAIVDNIARKQNIRTNNFNETRITGHLKQHMIKISSQYCEFKSKTIWYKKNYLSKARINLLRLHHVTIIILNGWLCSINHYPLAQMICFVSWLKEWILITAIKWNDLWSLKEWILIIDEDAQVTNAVTYRNLWD